MPIRRGRTTRRTAHYSTLEDSLLTKQEKEVLTALDATLAPGSQVPTHLDKCRGCCATVCNKGVISILFMLTVIIGAIIILGVSYATQFNLSNEAQMIMRNVALFFLSAGIFGVAGAGTNLLALLMLFYKIPLLIGTGVIPRQNDKVLEVLKKIVLQILLDSQHLEHYIQERINRFSVEVNIVDCITQALNSSNSDHIIDTHLSQLYSQPEALYLNALGVTKVKLKPLIRPAVLSLCAETAPLILGRATEKRLSGSLPVNDFPVIHRALREYLMCQTTTLTEERLRTFMIRIVYHKLQWLVVLSSAFGFLIGIIAQALRLRFNNLSF